MLTLIPTLPRDLSSSEKRARRLPRFQRTFNTALRRNSMSLETSSLLTTRSVILLSCRTRTRQVLTDDHEPQSVLTIQTFKPSDTSNSSDFRVGPFAEWQDQDRRAVFDEQQLNLCADDHDGGDSVGGWFGANSALITGPSHRADTSCFAETEEAQYFSVDRYPQQTLTAHPHRPLSRTVSPRLRAPASTAFLCKWRSHHRTQSRPHRTPSEERKPRRRL